MQPIPNMAAVVSVALLIGFLIGLGVGYLVS